MNVLIGDIGGTKTILAVFSSERGPRDALARKTYPSAQYETLESMIGEFFEEFPIDTSRACFGVAGPVIERRARITNLSWVVDGPALQSFFGWSEVALLNDMRAIGCAIPVLEEEDLHTLSAGTREPGGSIAVLAPGTGLGEGYLTYDGGSYHAHGCEGSHAAFAPVGPLQMGLLAYMNGQGFDHVSFERVCSGGLGIPNLYAYLKTTGLAEPVLAGRRDRLRRRPDSRHPLGRAGSSPSVRTGRGHPRPVCHHPGRGGRQSGSEDTRHRRNLSGGRHVAPDPRRAGEAGLS